MRFRLFLCFSVILVSLAFLAFGLKNSSSQDSILVIDTSKAAQKPSVFSRKSQQIRLRGFVKPGSILRSWGDQARFIIEQDGYGFPVFYRGKTQLPDTFTDGAPIRVDGYIKASPPQANTDEYWIDASRVEAKCTSKYKAPSRAYPKRGGMKSNRAISQSHEENPSSS